MNQSNCNKIPLFKITSRGPEWRTTSRFPLGIMDLEKPWTYVDNSAIQAFFAIDAKGQMILLENSDVVKFNQLTQRCCHLTCYGSSNDDIVAIAIHTP